MQIVVKTPSECSPAEIDEFIALITAGGEVAAGGLEQRIMSAAHLVLLLSNERAAGIAAIKNPNQHYRDHVASASGIALPASSFPYELGWVFVAPDVRGKGYGQSLSQAALAFAEGHGVFATSRIDNARMHHTLAKLGFIQVGEAYVSRRGDHHLLLFTRTPPNNSSEAASLHGTAKPKHKALGVTNSRQP
jgi:predicted GNAT family N-acyltransferase